MFHIDWQTVFQVGWHKAFDLIVLIVIFVLMDKFFMPQLASFLKKQINQDGSEQRKLTLYKLFLSFGHYILYFFVGYYALSILGFPMATLIAGAGIAGLAIGLGAQGFINDLVNGIFILIEHQFDVDDLVVIGNVEGVVKSIGLRITTIRGLDGSLFYIRNKDISTVNNLSVGTRRVVISLPVQETTNIESLINRIKSINETLLPQYPEVVQDPVLLGLHALPSGQLRFQVALYVQPDAYTTIQHVFYEQYLKAYHQ